MSSGRGMRCSFGGMIDGWAAVPALRVFMGVRGGGAMAGVTAAASEVGSCSSWQFCRVQKRAITLLKLGRHI